MRKFLIFLLVIGASLGGSLFSFNMASSVYLFRENILRGVMAAGNLPKLDCDKNDALKLFLENDVDDALVRYSYAEEEWWFPLYKSGWMIVLQLDNEKFDKWIKYIATYRKSHTSPNAENEFKGVSDTLRKNDNNHRFELIISDYQRRVTSIVNKYHRKKKKRKRGQSPLIGNKGS